MKIKRRAGSKHALVIVGIVGFCCAQGLYRHSSRKMVRVNESKLVYREYDPRGRDVEIFRKRGEREYYKVKGGFMDAVSLPGLTSLDFSVTWLRILVSTYEDASVEGDFSWLFHKLRFISHNLPKDEASFQTALMPFFVVLGKDPAGALYLLHEKLSKFKTDWRVSYWTGFHALENLKEKKMAGILFLEASKYPGCPDYLASLGVRLLQNEGEPNYAVFRSYAIKNLEPHLLEKLKRVRPEWFQETGGK